MGCIRPRPGSAFFSSVCSFLAVCLRAAFVPLCSDAFVPLTLSVISRFRCICTFLTATPNLVQSDEQYSFPIPEEKASDLLPAVKRAQFVLDRDGALPFLCFVEFSVLAAFSYPFRIRVHSFFLSWPCSFFFLRDSQAILAVCCMYRHRVR